MYCNIDISKILQQMVPVDGTQGNLKYITKEVFP
jgi:hypothetical protein